MPCTTTSQVPRRGPLLILLLLFLLLLLELLILQILPLLPFRRRLRPNAILYQFVIFSFAFAACKAIEVNQSSIMQFSEGGEVWGYGPITLAPLEVAGRIGIERTSVQTLDSSGFRVFMAQSGHSLPRERIEPLYADWHPERSLMAIYKHKFELEQRRNARNVFNLYAVLKRPGPSREEQKRVYLGYAVFYQGSRIAWLELMDGLSISQAAQIRLSEQKRWILHYPPLSEANSITSKRQGRFHFVSTTIEAENGDNASLCQDYFYTLVRTREGRINHSCLVTIAPSPEPTSNKLTCSVDIKITALSQAGEENCLVTGYFVANGESHAAKEVVTLSL